MHSDLVQREKERMGLYRQKTKAALVIQLAWRRYMRLKRQREAIAALSRALQVSCLLSQSSSQPGHLGSLTHSVVELSGGESWLL